MPRPRVSRIGKIFGRLTVICQQHIDPPTYLCRCECGNEVSVKYARLVEGSRKSCGCLNAENLAAQRAIGVANRERRAAARVARLARPKKTTHPLWGTYKGMLKRCLLPTHDAYKYYGAVGVTVCERWVRSFWAFVEDMGERPEGTTLDRVDNSKGYSPDNCRWATNLEQRTNTKSPGLVVTLCGVTKLLTDWARERGFNVESARRDIKAGMPEDVAVVAAVLRKRKFAAEGGQPPEVWEECYTEARRRLGD